MNLPRLNESMHNIITTYKLILNYSPFDRLIDLLVNVAPTVRARGFGNFLNTVKHIENSTDSLKTPTVRTPSKTAVKGDKNEIKPIAAIKETDRPTVINTKPMIPAKELTGSQQFKNDIKTIPVAKEIFDKLDHTIVNNSLQKSAEDPLKQYPQAVEEKKKLDNLQITKMNLITSILGLVDSANIEKLKIYLQELEDNIITIDQISLRLKAHEKALKNPLNKRETERALKEREKKERKEREEAMKKLELEKKLEKEKQLEKEKLKKKTSHRN